MSKVLLPSLLGSPKRRFATKSCLELLLITAVEIKTLRFQSQSVQLPKQSCILTTRSGFEVTEISP